MNNPQTIRLAPSIHAYLTLQGISIPKLLETPFVRVPDVDDTLPITDYFISSSHNTYLLGHQLLGHSSSTSYTHVLTHPSPARCIEIDVWPSTHGLIVTHGYTLSTSIPLEDVAVAIGDVVGEDSWPVFVSLECHVGVEGQGELVGLLRMVWGGKLVVGRLGGASGGEEGEEEGFVVKDVDDVEIRRKPTPRELRGRIILMVEYYPPEDFDRIEEDEEKVIEDGLQSLVVVDTPATMESEVPGEDIPRVLVGKVERGKISEELAELGFYARSMKPFSTKWLDEPLLTPPHILLNISEPTLLSLLPTLPSMAPLHENAQKHLRRVYPKGTRINSSNVDTLGFWRMGTQIVAVNWQRWDWGREVCEGMFGGTGGWVEKPQWMRGGGGEGEGEGGVSVGTTIERERDREGEVRLVCEFLGGSSLPTKPSSKTYIHAELHHELKEHCLTWDSPVVPTTPFASPTSSESPTSPASSVSSDLLFLPLPPTSPSSSPQTSPPLSPSLLPTPSPSPSPPLPRIDWTYPTDPLAFLRLGVRVSEVGEDREVGWVCGRVDWLDLGGSAGGDLDREYADGNRDGGDREGEGVWRIVKLRGRDGNENENGASVCVRVFVGRV